MIKKILATLGLTALSTPVFATGIEFVVIGVVFTLADVVLIATLALSAYMAIKAKNIATGSQSQSQQKQTLKIARPPKQVIYGKGLFAGALIFAEEEIGGEKNDDGTYKEWLHTSHGFCNHEVDGVEDIYFDEININQFGSFETHAIHNNDTVVDQYLLDNSPSWESDMIGRGTLWLRVSMLFDREKYANGMPTVLAIIRGKKIYDPRTATTVYSNNAALVIYDYFVTHMRIEPSRMMISGFGSFLEAANMCDELVEGKSRYTINGRFNLSEKPNDILGSLLASCGGQLIRVGGQIGLLPAAYYGGVGNITLGSSDIIGGITIQPEPSYSDSVNTVKGTFVDPDQDYVETEYPPIVDEAAKVKVGGEIATDMNFLFVTNPDQAQRLASIQLNRILAGGGVELETNLTGLYCRVGAVINLDIPELSMIGEYRVLSTTNHIREGVTVTVANDGPAIYDDAVGIPFVSPTLTNLPINGVAPPWNLTFISEYVGEVIQGRLVWEIIHPQSASTDVRIKRVSDGVIVLSQNVIGNSMPVNGLLADNYIMEVRTVSVSGATSTWTSESFLIDIPNAPTSIEIYQSNWNIRLVPNVSGGVPAGTLFEFKYLADIESYLTGNPTYGEGDINNANTKSVFTGSSFNHGGLTPDRYHHYWVRSINSYGASAWTYSQTWTLNDQDLITTVVQRLEAIEIVSSNYLAGQNGYKIWSDGVAEFYDITARGDIYAETLTFITPGAIPPEIDNANVDPYNDSWIYPNQTSIQIKSGNYVAGSVGWAIDSYGAAEFSNVVVRGVGYFTDGYFAGTVYAEKIVGDIVSVAVKSNSAVSRTTIGQTLFTSAVINTARNWKRYVKFPSVRLKVSAQFTASCSGRIKYVFAGSTIYSGTLTATNDSDSDRLKEIYTPNMLIEIPANWTGVCYLYADMTATGGSCTLTVSPTNTNNLNGWELISAGGDIS